jgi:hypothetical protein
MSPKITLRRSVRVEIAALAIRVIHSNEIEFSFLNGNLMVPAAHMAMFRHDGKQAVATDASSTQLATTV